MKCGKCKKNIEVGDVYCICNACKSIYCHDCVQKIKGKCHGKVSPAQEVVEEDT